jgi:hypothetical protein
MVIEPIKLTEEEKTSRQELSYEWIAYYKDGTVLNQYNEKEELTYNFGHIDQDKIFKFKLIPKKDNLYSIEVNLETGLFYIDDKPFIELYRGETRISLGLLLDNKKVISPWGNKAKLIYLRHIRRDFIPNETGFGMKVSVIYDIGWEADVDGKHEKYVLMVDEEGKLGIPPTFEEQGFKSL